MAAEQGEWISVKNITLGRNLESFTIPELMEILERDQGEETSVLVTIDFTNAKDLKEFGYSGVDTAPSIVLPRSLRKLGLNALSKSRATSIDIPDNVSDIEAGCFAMCENLETVKIPSVMQVVPTGCFVSTRVDPTEVMHNNIKRIEESAFDYSLRTTDTTVVMPAKLEYIGDFAFYTEKGFLYTYDFRKCEQVPTLSSLDALSQIDKILVSPAMYGAFGTAPVWSDIADKLVIA